MAGDDRTLRSLLEATRDLAETVGRIETQLQEISNSVETIAGLVERIYQDE